MYFGYFLLYFRFAEVGSQFFFYLRGSQRIIKKNLNCQETSGFFFKPLSEITFSQEGFFLFLVMSIFPLTMWKVHLTGQLGLEDQEGGAVLLVHLPRQLGLDDQEVEAASCQPFAPWTLLERSGAEAMEDCTAVLALGSRVQVERVYRTFILANLTNETPSGADQAGGHVSEAELDRILEGCSEFSLLQLLQVHE